VALVVGAPAELGLIARPEVIEPPPPPPQAARETSAIVQRERRIIRASVLCCRW
jgi:hypothetical protein